MRYIKESLNEPKIALKIAIKIRGKIAELSLNPKRYQIIDEIIIKKIELRKFAVKNYLIFYKIYESEKIVKIIRILYAKRNWKEIL